MIRHFYFLRDRVSGKLYTGQGYYMSHFKDAAVYYSEKNAINRVKGVIQAWEHALKYPVEEKYRKEFERSQRPWPNDLVTERKGLEDWGIIIVKRTVKL